MDGETTERVTEWSERSFSGGYAGLHDLADREFSGAVSAESTWLLFTNGRVVAVVDGSIEAFADADGRVYEAPDPSVPLLFAMFESDTERRAQYYTEETPLSEADQTLSAGNFTGYVELSENVLSGDYYVVYHGGESSAAAFVGNTGRLVAGDEAFERAADEVGIYDVVIADVSVTEIPEPASEGPTEGSAAATPNAQGDQESPTRSTDDQESPTRSTDDQESPTDTDSTDPDGQTPDAKRRGADPDADNATARGSGGEGSSPVSPSERWDGNSDRGRVGGPTDRPVGDTPEEEDDDGRTSDDDGREPPAPADWPVDGDRDDASPAGGAEDRFEEEAEWRETVTIPAVDPQSSTAESDDGGPTPDEGDDQGGSPATRPKRPGPRVGGGTDERLDRVESKLESVITERDELAERRDELAERRDELAERRDELVEERDRVVAERDELRDRVERVAAERDELREEAERLRSEVEELEAELERVRSELQTASGPGERSMEPAAALAATNLFVRYRSRGGPTLEDARNGEAARAEIEDNLRLETHAAFEADDVAVAGEAFSEWLADTVQYGFGNWVVRDLPYEIRETGAAGSLDELYDAIPAIDRIEFGGEVTVDVEEGAEGAAYEFDVVCRDRMGDPLIVADFNDALEPATGSQMERLVSASRPVVESHDGLAAAFFVTSSYFEPQALEIADQATGGGRLSRLGRNSRASYVRRSRNAGFHLCLVETRNDEYHVTVPEL